LGGEALGSIKNLLAGNLYGFAQYLKELNLSLEALQNLMLYGIIRYLRLKEEVD
jgi:hypothetical protein